MQDKCICFLPIQNCFFFCGFSTGTTYIYSYMYIHTSVKHMHQWFFIHTSTIRKSLTDSNQGQRDWQTGCLLC